MNKSDLLKISQEIRGIITEKQKEMELTFIEDTHTYHIRKSDGEMTTDYPSVSTVIGQFYTPFPDVQKSFEMSEGCLMSQDVLLKEWRATADYANSQGSRVHYLLEMKLLEMYGSYKEVRQPIFDCNDEQIKNGDIMIEGGLDFIKEMHKRGAVLLDTEMVLGSQGLKYTGQPDKVWLMLDKNGELGIVITDWKGLPLETPIFTDSGWKTMGTLTKNDMVYDKDGDLVNILNISQIKNKKCLKIKFDNNEEIVSDFEHRWLVYTERGGIKEEMVMTTQEIKDYNDNLLKRHSNKILKIGNPKPLNNTHKELPIDPYVLGVWLGDGHSVDAKITQANELVWEQIKLRGYNIGDDVSQGGCGEATTRTVFGLQTQLRLNNLLRNKHVPSVYLSSSYEQRLDLLRGLMDSDGTYNKRRKRFVMETTRESQADYYNEVISSLGVKTTKIFFNKNFNGKVVKCYSIQFNTTEFNPFLCRNQDLIIEPKTNKRLHRTIVSVEEVESTPTKCIEVDSPSSTFLFGKTFIVTHNTNKPKNFEVQPYTEKMLNPFEEYYDTALSHYMIQLPLYGRLLLDMLKGTKYEGIKFLGCVIVHLLHEGVHKYVEYRIPKKFMNTVLTMNPLPRIKYVKQQKKEAELLEKRRQFALDMYLGLI